ncbi:MAG: S8 family serine peptidase, partial [Stellaceae bacterium]
MPAISLLVKTTGLPRGRAFAVTGIGNGITAEPLFRSILPTGGLGVAAPSSWWILKVPDDGTPGHSWDKCHDLVRRGFGIAGAAAAEFAEPDLEQQWVYTDENRQAMGLVNACAAPEPQDPRYPTAPGEFWYRDAERTQFDAALAQIGDPGDGRRVRIAHLDTGYDPNHATVPPHLRRDLGRNFVDDDWPEDASDRTEGVLTNLGHGTGTIGILAGNALSGNSPPVGAAPFAEVVPIRVANRVVLFSNSAIARGLDYVHTLASAGTTIHVVTMSMGGIPSQAWADAVNALYEQGVFIVTAAGNNFGNLPTHEIVYPARFRRVVAACGMMADGKPYADLPINLMAGNYGPAHKMLTALTACTPNIPWAKLGCANIVDWDGGGTSAATPQIAAAAAMWIQKNAAAWTAYPEDWMRVEAVRKALFETARAPDAAHFGRGLIHVTDALAAAPATSSALSKEAPDDASFSLLRLITGLGLQAVPEANQRMLELEALQLSMGGRYAAILPSVLDPQPAPADLRRLANALASDPRASQALRAALGQAARADTPLVPVANVGNPITAMQLEIATRPRHPAPPARRLRIYAFDPTLAARLETLSINESVAEVPWEPLEPGPVGEYLEVIDIDPSSRACYAPVDLDDRNLLATNGLTPSEANPQFHQQMAYAVARQTIDYFERALGRRALWAPRFVRVNGKTQEQYVQRLRIYPHALRAANAYYSPEHKALLFGYFRASELTPGDDLPGGTVFGCLSHDIVSHETTHALLDGLHRRFAEPTTPDALAFHEAFADIVAIFQHFALPEALRHQIARTRGDIRRQNLLGELARQFGAASRGYGALRDAIGHWEDGQWVANKPSRDDYAKATEAHDRGAVLVAAVFDAFLQIYQTRTVDLLRLSSGGTGVLPEGSIPADLVDRLAHEAGKVAEQVLMMCIRALDYCPPIDMTFGDYLRALITADRDIVPDDRRAYRVAFISAFRDRGIHPQGVRHLGVESLAWEPPPAPLDPERLKEILAQMDLGWNLTIDRKEAWANSRKNAATLHNWLMSPKVLDREIELLGLSRDLSTAPPIKDMAGKLHGIEVHSVRPARRVRLDGTIRADLVIEITQTWHPEQP